MYINYHSAYGFSIKTYAAHSVGDITDLVKTVRKEGYVSCDLAGAKEALMDGSLWEDRDLEAIGAIFAAIGDWEMWQ
jgi:hypothetical protein